MPRRIASLVIISAIAVSCGGGEPSSSAAPQSVPSTGAQATPAATPSSELTPSPAGSPAAPAYPWEGAGEMVLGRGSTEAVLLGDGRVLVVGNEEYGCVRDDAAQAETWDPVAGSWTPTANLNQPRAELTAVTLVDGSAIVVGGVNPGDRYGTHNQTYSSTWLFDPAAADPWAKTGLLHTARGAPATVALADGRVLVTGGFYLSGTSDLGSAMTVAWHPAAPGEETPAPPGDVDPGAYGPALATAELYSPTTGEWTRTGAMRFARIDPAAVRLADGRVLVVGSRERMGYGWTRVDERAPVTAELYDPATGEFTFLGKLPEVDWSPIADAGPQVVTDVWTVDPVGTLVALPDGDALLVEAPWEWMAKQDRDEGRLVRLLRFHADSNAWTVVDADLTRHANYDDWPLTEVVAGHVRSDPMLAVLPDGRVLVAGGVDNPTVAPTDKADLYDPTTDTWTSLPPMPEIREGGAVVALPDGSVLLVGGIGRVPTAADDETDCGEGRTGLASTLRYVPGE